MIHNTKVSLIVAVDENRGIGKNGKMPWHIPADLKRFKELTTGNIVIMGRKTFSSIGKPLSNRTNIVITRDKKYKVNGALVASSLEEAIRVASSKYQVLSMKKNKKNIPIHDTKYKLHTTENEVFIIGGGQIFQEAINLADKLYLTLVEGKFDVDTYFPDYSKFTKKVSEEEGESNGFKYKFINLEKSRLIS
ncbi:MAG: diacylglycerol kinase [Candidatus Levybacteria bacterium CG_4_10_14_0_8_um_filter_35_23]|nr:MAG: diacylglycerol kinase [Candidatus Levybacteria bacterium CG_4_10_14_0_8_um_filter_35_23]